MTHHGTHSYYYEFLERNFKQDPITYNNFISTPTSIDGYTPKNQKLRTYPYMYLAFNPQNGNKKIFRYEDFENGTPSFKAISEINPNPTVEFIPLNYRGQSGESINDICALNGYPTVSFKTDVFNTWLAQNSDIIKLNMEQEEANYWIDQTKLFASGMTNVITKSLSVNPTVITDAVNLGLDISQGDINHEYYVKQQLAQVEKQKMLPDNVTMGSSNATLLGYDLMDNNIFTRYNIKRQFAEKIDRFFDMYGYLTNNVKIPNLNNRPNWNYVKTIGVNIIAEIPQIDLQAIKDLFNNGITLWHDTDTFLDYSQNNR